MLQDHIVNTIRKELNHIPTFCQGNLITALSEFMLSEKEKEILLVKGYAGTGKTTVISAFVRTLQEMKQRSILLAPTGRAAKVFASYSGTSAYTIHKKIYRQKNMEDGSGIFDLDKNFHSHTFFIVDEASMISNQGGESSAFGSGRLLDDLIEYVNNGLGCKLILVGDTAQLPPVGLDISPALDKKVLEGYGFDVKEIVLNEVVRQSEESGILFNATRIRGNITTRNKDLPKIITTGFEDVSRVSGADLIETLSDAYSKYGMDQTIVVNRSNKRANLYNRGIRNQILAREEELSIGDMLMVVKNNYYWLQDNEEVNFIANGDIAQIIRIKKYEELYDFHFADVTLKFTDYANLEIDTKIMLDTLSLESASLSGEANKKFFYSVLEDYANIPNHRKKIKMVRENPFFNALQVKFAYAVTCHKAQGGQWKAVFIDQGWFDENAVDIEYLRWLYTAFTRPTEKLYLVNFKDELFEGNMSGGK
ncbi:MAG: AAA family ATPase [Bacteroidota bacterium]|nr:AAA family ATPase [Bacteroidota bacterium]